jgi:spore coat protein U-like protein
MNKAIRLIAAGALLAAGLPLTASAQTITINASVAGQCNIGNATVNLGALTLLSGTVANIGTNISLTCNKGATVSVALNNGSNFFGGSKRLLSVTAADTINYNITVPNVAAGVASCPGVLPGTEWNATNTFTATTMFSSTGGPKNIPLCVSVPTPQYPATANDYSDIVTATLTVS